MNPVTKADKIRNALIDLGPSAKNREISDYCKLTYGVTVTHQNIYETLGPQSKRRLKQYNGAQIMDLKSTANRLFNGNYQEMGLAALALHDYVS